MTALHTDCALYDVGYGKPPRRTQFRNCQSGNPGGRPRREPVERLEALTLQEAYRRIAGGGTGKSLSDSRGDDELRRLHAADYRAATVQGPTVRD